jgi:hypothetical protein
VAVDESLVGCKSLGVHQLLFTTAEVYNGKITNGGINGVAR